MKLTVMFVVGCIIGGIALAGIGSLLGIRFKRLSKNPHKEKKHTSDTVRRA